MIVNELACLGHRWEVRLYCVSVMSEAETAETAADLITAAVVLSPHLAMMTAPG